MGQKNTTFGRTGADDFKGGISRKINTDDYRAAGVRDLPV
jgi:hypothetical protein